MKNTKRNKLWLLAIPALLVILAIVVTACNGSREEPAEPQINTTAAPTEQTQPVTETTEAVEETTEATEETTEATEETTEPTEETTAPTTGSNSGNSGDSDDSGTNPTVPKLEVPDPGTQKNPYVEVVSAYPGEVTTVNIPKKGTVSYMLWGVAGKIITIEDPDVKLVVGEKTYTADENGVLTADLSHISADTVVSMTNGGKEAKAFLLSVTEPLGSQNNPYILTDITSVRAELVSGDADGIWYSWTAPETGNLTLTALLPEEKAEQIKKKAPGGMIGTGGSKKKTADVDMETVLAALRAAMTEEEAPVQTKAAFDVIVTAGDKTVKLSACEGAELVAEVKKGKTVTIQIIALADGDGKYPAVTAELSGSLAVKPGSDEAYPIVIEDLSLPVEVTLAKGESVYYSGAFHGRTLTIADAADATLNADGTTITPDESGTIAAAFPKAEGEDPAPNRLCLTSQAEQTYTLVFGYPLGTAENPQCIIPGENRAELNAGNAEGHLFLWRSEIAGELTITLPLDAPWQYTLNGETHNSAEEPPVNILTLPVEANTDLLFRVNTFDPENPEVTPEGTVVFTASFLDPTLGTQENPQQLQLGETKVTLEPGDADGCWYTWTAEEAGSFTVTMTGEGWQYQLQNVTAAIMGTLHTGADDPAVMTETVSVAAGDVIRIFISTCDPADSAVIPGGEVIFTTEFVPEAQ